MFSWRGGEVLSFHPTFRQTFISSAYTTGSLFINTVSLFCPGTNMLMVGVHGPQSPCEEVYVKHMGNKLYNVTYTVKDKGSYIVIVKWGDDNVPGSPYKVVAP